MLTGQEGKAQFQVGKAFYRSDSQVARDLAVLAAALYKAEAGQLRVLDVMSGCGVRALRYHLEAGADWVWANDANPEVAPVLQGNLRPLLELGCGQITHTEAKRALFHCYQQRDYYDLVDVDSFGSPAAYLSASLSATKLGGLLYLTSTDGRTMSGHAPDISLHRWGVYARSHPALHEQGLRLLLGSLVQQSGMQELAIQPIFSFFQGQIYRVMVRLVTAPLSSVQHYGFLGYCHYCGHYQTVNWRQLSRATCPHSHQPLTLSGPLWLGPLHDCAMLTQMTTLAQAWNWPQRAALLEVMQAEADLPPYFYTLGTLGRYGKMDIPRRDRLLQALQAQGYRASATHIHAAAVKTTATFHECLAIARCC